MAHEYQAVVQLLQLTCHNCHQKLVVDPAQASAQELIAPWLKVQKADGENFGFCGVDCLQKGAHFFRGESAIQLTDGN